MVHLSGNPQVRAVADDTTARLRWVRDELAGEKAAAAYGNAQRVVAEGAAAGVGGCQLKSTDIAGRTAPSRATWVSTSPPQ